MLSPRVYAVRLLRNVLPRGAVTAAGMVGGRRGGREEKYFGGLLKQAPVTRSVFTVFSVYVRDFN